MTHCSRQLVPNVIGVILAFLTALLYPQEEPPKQTETWRTFEATAYVANCRGCTGITKSGIDVRQTQYDADGRRIIAVDPRVIALGTALEIRLADGYTFEAVAEDIGSAIKGARIDVLVPTLDRALTFGRQDVSIRVINEEETE